MQGKASFNRGLLDMCVTNCHSCQSKSLSTERNTIVCACRDGTCTCPTGAHELRGPLGQSLCVKSLLCISYLWLKKVYFINLLMALIECTCAVMIFLGPLRIPYAIYALKMANLSLSWFSSFLRGNRQQQSIPRRYAYRTYTIETIHKPIQLN